MKKMLILALIALFYMVSSALVPSNTVPIDDDVGICYVAPMDQVADVVVYIADNNTPSLPDSRSPVLSGVEKSDYIVIINSHFESPCLYDSHYGTPANLMTSRHGNNNVERQHRLDIGETLSRVGVTTRHIT